MEEEEVKSPREYLELLWRRKLYILIPFVVVSLIGTVVAIKLPPLYRSKAIILIEDQQVPRNMVQSTITDYADERIQLIKQRVMTQQKTLDMIKKFNLYAEDQKVLFPSELVKQFQENAEVALVGADVIDPSHGNASKATIAFTISFSDRGPEVAQNVANDLVSLFLEENARSRARQVKKTTDFLSEETEKLKHTLQEEESAVAKFKEKYGNSLPELVTSNLAMLDRLNTELRGTDAQISALKERIDYIHNEQAQSVLWSSTQPNAGQNQPMSEAELRARYQILSSQYTSSHPELIRLRRQIQSFDPDFDGGISSSERDRKIAKAKEELRSLLDKYSANHPDVQKLQRKIEAMENGKRASRRSSEEQDADGPSPHNPLEVGLKAQLKSAESELGTLQTQRETIRKRITEVEGFISQTPQVERGYQDVVREYENNKAKYQELLGKMQEAKLSQTLEEEQKGEVFTLIDPPAVPDKPEKPNRPKLILLSLFAGLGVGFGLVMLMEALDESVRGPDALKRITGLSPLVVIPYIENLADLEKKRRMTKTALMAGGASLLVLLIVFHLFVVPLDELWGKVTRKIARI